MTREEILTKYNPQHDNLLGILHDLQDANPANYLSIQDMKAVADFLNTSYSHIYGVATYYSMFSVRPRGKHIIRVCNSPVCNMEGASSVIGKIKEILGIEAGETTPDMLFTLEYTECLGRCSESPSVMIDRDIYGNVDPAAMEAIIEKYKE